MSQLHVICRIDQSQYAVPADEVYQMETFTTATPVPGAPAYVLGLVQIRQQVIPLLDLRARFGLSPKEPSIESRIVVLSAEDRLVGLLVDSAREVQHIAPEQFAPPPEVLARQSKRFVKLVAQLKDRIIFLLDTSTVVSQEIANG